MAREWLLRGVDPEELKREEKPEIPETPQSKWENFWYHHKWAFWGWTFAGVAVIIVLVQMFTSTSPDYRVLLMTEHTYMSGDVEKMENLLEQYATDLNGDGEVMVNVQNCMLGERALRNNNPGAQMVQAHLGAGDVLFFIWDAKTYDYFMQGITPKMKDGVEFLSDLPVEGPGIIENGKIYTWEWDPRHFDMEDTFPTKMYFGVRNLQGTAADESELHKQCMKLMEAFILDKKPEK